MGPRWKCGKDTLAVIACEDEGQLVFVHPASRRLPTVRGLCALPKHWRGAADQRALPSWVPRAEGTLGFEVVPT